MDLIQAQLDAQKQMEERDEQAKQAKIAERKPTLLQETGLSDLKNFDFDKAILDDDKFEQEEDGGWKLPVKNFTGVTVAGYDLGTGEARSPKWRDPEITDGIEQIRNSYWNTVSGPSKDTTTGLIKIASGILKNGGAYEDFDFGYDEKTRQNAWNLAQSLHDQRSMLSGLMDGKKAEFSGPMPQLSRTYTEEELKKDQTWLGAARHLYEVLEGEPFKGTDEQLHNLAVEEVAITFSNLAKLGMLNTKFANGEYDENTAKAYLTLMLGYEAMENTGLATDGRIVLGNILGIAQDPTTYAAIGGMLIPGGQSHSTTAMAARLGIKQKIAQLITKRLIPAAGIGSVEGLVYGGLEDLAIQGIEMQAGEREEIDVGRMQETGRQTAAVGAVLGPMVNIAPDVVRGGWKQGKRFGKHVQGNFDMRPVGPIMKQVGSLNPQMPKAREAEIGLRNKTDMGEDFIDTAEPMFKSRLQGALFGDPAMKVQPLVGKKDTTAGGLLQMIDKLPQNQKLPVSNDEIRRSGIRDILESMPKDEKLTRERLDDMLWVNRDRANAWISGEKGPLGTSTGDTPKFMLKQMVDTHIAQRAYRIIEEEVPMDPQPFLDWQEHIVRRGRAWAEQNAFPAGEGVNKRLDVIEEPTIPPWVAQNAPEWGDAVLMQAKHGKIGKVPELKLPPSGKRYKLMNANGEFEALGDQPVTYTSSRDAIRARDDMVKNMTRNMDYNEQIEMLRMFDEKQVMRPPQYEEKRVRPDVAADGYFEMRLFQPFEGTQNVEDIALGRFGQAYEALSPDLKARVDDMKKWAHKDPRMTEDRLETTHYPTEINRISHIRGQRVYRPDGGTSLMVMEGQADINNWARPENFGTQPKSIDQNAVNALELQLKKDIAANSTIPLSDDQLESIVERARESDSIKAFSSMSGVVNKKILKTVKEYRRITGRESAVPPHMVQGDSIHRRNLIAAIRYAASQGIDEISFPASKQQIMNIQGWPEEFLDSPQAKPILDLYLGKKGLQKVIKDPVMTKDFDIKVSQEPRFADRNLRYGMPDEGSGMKVNKLPAMGDLEDMLDYLENEAAGDVMHSNHPLTYDDIAEFDADIAKATLKDVLDIAHSKGEAAAMEFIEELPQSNPLLSILNATEGFDVTDSGKGLLNVVKFNIEKVLKSPQYVNGVVALPTGTMMLGGEDESGSE